MLVYWRVGIADMDGHAFCSCLGLNFNPFFGEKKLEFPLLKPSIYGQNSF